VAGAPAALAGLLFVAVSINLDRIISLGLPSRAIGAITGIAFTLLDAVVEAWVLLVEIQR
jgi:hypothetical protein